MVSSLCPICLKKQNSSIISDAGGTVICEFLQNVTTLTTTTTTTRTPTTTFKLIDRDARGENNIENSYDVLG